MENLSHRRNVVFVHPDLGIGGAERLIIDAAVGLQKLGHKVTIYTSHCDPRHCFEEARDGMATLQITHIKSPAQHLLPSNYPLLIKLSRNPRRPHPRLLHPPLPPLA